MSKPLKQFRPRIVVVEDDEALLELVTLRLELAGYDTYSARNGADGLRQIHAVMPAGVLLDINMPVMDGFAVLRELKGPEPWKAAPTMVMTARNRPGDVQMAIALGARDYVAKPFDEVQFLARVERLVRKAPAPAPLPAAIVTPPENDNALMI